ncbi:MAG: sulfate ABC transporter substrate-binding protein [Kiritimatiellae bacterium]|nr:sulfate ABC transporter substrate-binding protein [Kiritimatiellia bacterium]
MKKNIFKTGIFGLAFGAAAAWAAPVELLNVSYDPTRELYRAYNEAFERHWKETTGEDVHVKQSHGGSGKQARAVIDGVPADVVSLALGYDIDAITFTGKKLIPRNWQERLPLNSSPYTSTIVFLVRKGNPKNIKTWEDLVKDGVQVITPNPKTSGGARWNQLAAWGYILERELGDIKKVRDPAYKEEVKAAELVATAYLKKLYAHVPVLDSGARGATTTFVQRKIGDVLLAWENEAILSVAELGEDAFDIVVPPVTILTEPPVSIVDANVAKRGAKIQKLAEEYLKYLYSPEAQKIIAHYGYRPQHPEYADKEDIAKFADARLLKLDDLYRTWRVAQKVHFSDGGLFDQVYAGK